MASVDLTFRIATVHALNTREFCEELKRVMLGLPPQLLPSHFGFNEPISEVFEVEHIESQLRQLWDTEYGEIATLARSTPPKQMMNLDLRRYPEADSQVIAVRFDYAKVCELRLVDEIVEYFRQLVQISQPEYGHATLSARFGDSVQPAGERPNVVAMGMIDIPVVGFRKLCGLLDMMWLNYFSRTYAEWLGLTPTVLKLANSWERDGHTGGVWIRTSGTPERAFAESGLAVRNAIRANIRKDAFIPDNANPFEIYQAATPGFDRSEIRRPMTGPFNSCE